MSSAKARGQSDTNLSSTRNIRLAGEVLLFALGTISAWMYGGNTPHVEYILTLGITILVGLWLAHSYLSNRWRIKFDLCSGCLLGLILLCFVQLVPLPVGIVKLLAPARAELYEFLVPAQSERLANETSQPRTTMIPITVDATATRLLLARLLSVFAVYTVVRSWLISRNFVLQLLWVLTANGTVLAILALGQFFSSARSLMFWSIDVGASVYGTFVCRNHYPDFLAWSIGAAIALVVMPDEEEKENIKKAKEQGSLPIKTKFLESLLDLFTAPLKLLDRPNTLIPAICLGIMLVSIPISLSRGGLIAYVVAGVGVWLLSRICKPTSNSLVGWALTLTFGSFLALLLWFGVSPIMSRFESIWENGDNRSDGWKSSITQVSGNWLIGTGGGSHQRVEPMGRTTQPPTGIYDHAHNEYLEALVEGGLLRLSLTLLLVFGSIALMVWGYRQRNQRSIGSTLLGMSFAMLVLAIHAFFDFAIHMPAVALVSAIGLAVGLGATQDATLVSARVRNRKKSSQSSSNLLQTNQTSPDTAQPKQTESAETPILGMSLTLLLFGMLVMLSLEARSRYRADSFDAAADSWRETTQAGRFDQRIEYQSTRCRITPHDADAWADLGVAYLDGAINKHPDGQYSQAVLESHITPALQALRKSRDLNPYLPQVQARLGLQSRRFKDAESPDRYLDRAIRLLPTDAELHFACGVEAHRAGKTEKALTDWKRSLELDTKWLRPILREAKSISGQRLCDSVLPAQPQVLVQAANELYPEARLYEAARRVFLEKAMAKPDETGNWSAEQLGGYVLAGEELNRTKEVDRQINLTLSQRSLDAAIRNVAASWYERQERYTEALEHLDWLASYDASNDSFRMRLRLARHGARLQRALTEP